MFPDYQISITIHWRGQSSETSSYEPQPAHSTGLPKPPGYNLEWSRVSPIQDALVTGPPTKASHHDHTLKRCWKLSSSTITGPKSPGTHLTSLGRILAPNRLAGISHCQAPSTSTVSHCSVTAWRFWLAPPGAHRLPGLLLPCPAWRHPPYRQAPCAPSDHCHSLRLYRLAPRSTPPGAIPVAQNY